MKVYFDWSRVFKFRTGREILKDTAELGYNSALPFVLGVWYARTGNFILLLAFFLVMWLKLEVILGDGDK